MKRFFVFLFCCSLSCISNADIIVYQNMTDMTIASFRMGLDSNLSLEFGDQVQLSGTARTVTQIRTIMQVYGEGAPTNGLPYNFDLTVRFRELSGSTLNNSPFYQQTITLSPAIPAGFSGGVELTLPIPNVLVPDEFAVMFRYTRNPNSNNGGVGNQFNGANPVAVGSSDPSFFWVENFGSGTWSTSNLPFDRSNMALEITAIPEPGHMTGLTLLSLLAIARRRAR